MTDPKDPEFGDILSGAVQPAPRSRREARLAEVSSTKQAPGHEPPTKKTQRRRGLVWLISIVAVLALLGGATAYAWTNYEEQIRKVLGWELPPDDYVGEGSGEVTIVIVPGDNGEDITNTLLQAGVIKGYKAFYALLLEEDPRFYPGYYQLRSEMSSRAALDLLLDPSSRLQNTALIIEGTPSWKVFELLSAATSLPVEDFEAAASDPQTFGLPASATNLEGFLFPARYTFDPGADATAVLKVLVDRTFQSLDAAGVAPDDRLRIVTIASLIQREAGGDLEDFAKVSRVIQNRVDKGMKLQFDSTAHYGYVWKHGEREKDSVFTSKEELADDNPYNTYMHTGLPIGPIGAAGDAAIKAALNPADGAWLFFVTVNLDTGETVFTETLAQHEAAVKQLQNWCKTSGSKNCG